MILYLQFMFPSCHTFQIISYIPNDPLGWVMTAFGMCDIIWNVWCHWVYVSTDDMHCFQTFIICLSKCSSCDVTFGHVKSLPVAWLPVTWPLVTSFPVKVFRRFSDILNLKPGALYGGVFCAGCDVTSGHAKSGHMMTSFPFPVTQLPVASLPAKVFRLFGGMVRRLHDVRSRDFRPRAFRSSNIQELTSRDRNWRHTPPPYTPPKTPLHYFHPCRNLNGGLTAVEVTTLTSNYIPLFTPM